MCWSYHAKTGRINIAPLLLKTTTTNQHSLPFEPGLAMQYSANKGLYWNIGSEVALSL